MSVSVAQAGKVNVLLTPVEQKLLVTNPDSIWQEKTHKVNRNFWIQVCDINPTIYEAHYESSPTYYKKIKLSTPSQKSHSVSPLHYAQIHHKQFSLSVQEQTSCNLYIGKQLLIEG